MQVSGLGVGQTASSLYANEGVAAFWKGLAFAWGREIFYTSIKLGGEFACDWSNLGRGGTEYEKDRAFLPIRRAKNEQKVSPVFCMTVLEKGLVEIIDSVV